MSKLNVRQGILGGGVVALMAAAGAAGRSPDPMPVFVSVVAVGLASVAAVAGLAAAINRSAKPPVRW